MINKNSFEHQGYIYSAVLHLVVMVLVIFGLPEFWRQHRESLPVAMTVEILPIGQTNVKPKEQIEATKTAKNNKPVTALKAKSATNSNQPKPKPKPAEVIPMPDAKKEKPKEKPKEEPKEEEESEDLDAILKSIEKASKAEESDKVNKESTEDSKKAVFDDYNPSLPLAMSEIDAIRQQFMKCWNVPAGARDAHNLSVLLEVRLNSDGSVMDVELAQDSGRYYSDTFFRAAADSAIRAVKMCSPLKNLPADKYDTWKYLELSFDPRDMLY